MSYKFFVATLILLAFVNSAFANWWIVRSSQAGERLMSAAEERGLNKEGLKEVAEDVGSTFSAAIKGEESSVENHRKFQMTEEQAQSRGAQAQRVSQTPSSKPNASAKRGQQ